MATAHSEGGVDSSFDIILRDNFIINKKEYDVELYKDCIKCKIVENKQKVSKAECLLVLSIADILSVDVTKEKDSSKSPSTGVIVQHVEKIPPYTLRAVKAILHKNDNDACVKWSVEIEKLLQPYVVDRPKKLLVLVNPKSGNNKGNRIYHKSCAPIFKICNIQTDVIVTERAGHIEDILQEHDLSSTDGVVSVGGDGTFTELINGLLRREARDDGRDISNVDNEVPPLRTTIGILPAGSSQGNVKVANGVVDAETAAINIAKGKTFKLDAFGVYTNNKLIRFGNILFGYGLSSSAAIYSENNRWMGQMRYLYGFAKSVVKMRSFHSELEYLVPANNKDIGVEGWKKSEGEYVSFLAVPFDLAAGKYIPGAMYMMNIMQTNRKTVLNIMKKMATLDDSMHDYDCIEKLYVSELKIKVPLTKERARGQNEEHQGTPPVPAISVDGDPFYITTDNIHLKVYKDLCTMFGPQPTDWLDHADLGLGKKRKTPNKEGATTVLQPEEEKTSKESN